MARMTQHTAVEILTSIEAKRGQDFYTLNSSQVEALLEYADELGYRKPKNANGSRARYFYAYVQRSAVDREFSGFVTRHGARIPV